MKINKTDLLTLIHEVLQEKKLSKSEKAGLKKMEKSVPMSGFTKSYGKKKGKEVYYATLTKQAKEKY